MAIDGDSSRYNICYLTENNKCIGYCSYKLETIGDKKYYIIHNIMVINKKRRMGFATDIVNHIEELHPGYIFDDRIMKTIKGDRFFHKTKKSKLDWKSNEY